MKKLLMGIVTALVFGAGGMPADAKSLGVSLASDTNPFYIAMLKGIRAQAEKLGYDVSVVNAEEDIAKQLNGLNDLIAKGVSAILVSPIDAKALCSAYDKAKSANVPILSIARGSACESQTLHVAVDELRVGKEIAAWIADKIGNKGKVAMLAGPSGAQAFIRFAKGFTDEMANHKDIQIVFRREMLLTRENGLKNAEDALVAHPDLRAIYGANDELGMGAAQAVQAAGKKSDIVVTGMNGIPPAIAAVKRGAMDLTVSLNPVQWGILGANTADAALKGEKLDREVYVEHNLVDSANVDKFMR